VTADDGLEDFYSLYDERARKRREHRAQRRRPPRGRRERPRPRLAAPARVGQSLAEARHLARTPAGRILVGAVAGLAVLTLIGLAVLWPRGLDDGQPTGALGGPTVAAEVVSSGLVQCPGPTPQQCRQLRIAVEGRTVPLGLGPVEVTADLRAGDRLRVNRVRFPPGTPASVRASAQPYTFVDVDRQGSLALLAAVLAVVSLVILRWRGLLAVLGVGLSIALLTLFVVPAILGGRPALLVALVGSMAVMFVTVALTNGIGAQSMAAALGVAATLALTCVLALAAVGLAHLDGRSNELSQVLATQDTRLSLQGVVLAGMLIGALGVLADTAVTQASAVMALRRADPGLDARGLYRGAVVVGRDHLSATIHTLVLAYAGASLPLLLVLRSAGVDVVDGLTTQDIAEPIAATIVGCLGLIAAVPLTTGLASWLVARVPVDAVPAGHGHH